MEKKILYILICGIILNGLYGFAFAQGKVGKTGLVKNEDQCLTCHKDIDMLPEVIRKTIFTGMQVLLVHHAMVATRQVPTKKLQ